LVILSGCPEFKSIEQPSSVLEGRTFTVFIEATTFGGGDSEPYFGVRLPNGWTIPGDAIPFTGICDGTIVYDANLALEQESLSPSPAGYTWWVGTGSYEDSEGESEGGSVYAEVQIQTDYQTGRFSIDYFVGAGLDFFADRSDNHLIELVDEYTPREPQAVVQGATVSLSWGAPFISEGLTGYDVYRDGQIINTDPVVDTVYVDENPVQELVCYSISSLYDNGDVYLMPYEIKVLFFSVGTGDPNDPYQIADAVQLVSFSNADFPYLLDKCFVLVNDIDLDPNLPGGQVFDRAVIAPDMSDLEDGFQGTAFTGIFDGNGFSLHHLHIQGASHLGLFGYLGDDAVVTNLGLKDVSIEGTGNSVGGLVGHNGGSVSNSCSTGRVSGRGRFVGGLAGYNDGSISHSCSASAVTGDRTVGGLVGFHGDSIFYSYSIGVVTGVERVGGLVGNGSGRTIASYWDMETSGQSSSAGGTGLTTAQMQMADTFIGWGCDSVWTIDEGVDYPRLFWESLPGELIAKPSYGGGSGTEANPYLIHTAEQLNMIGLCLCDWDRHFKLMADIDLGGYKGGQFNFIGIDNWAFTGIFDGNGHTISNFSYTYTEGQRGLFGYIGLFGYVDDPNAEIKDLGLLDPEIDAGAGSNVGSLVGRLDSGTVSACYAKGGTVSGRDGGIGGLVGRNDGGSISNSFSTSVVTGERRIGGLVGDNDGSISDSYSTCAVTGETHVGGLVGDNGGSTSDSFSTSAVEGDECVGGLVGGNNGSVSNSYSTGAVTGVEGVGGLVGNNNHGDSVTNSYSTGMVTGVEGIGGLVGNNDGSVSNSFWDVQISGLFSSAGGVGLTTAEMQDIGPFLQVGWDFADETQNGTDDIWWILEGQDYPRLWWEPWPRCVSFPYPQHGDVNMSQPLVLTWQVGTWAAHHDVYFGENEKLVAVATTEDMEVYQGRLPAILNIYEPGPLMYGTAYYWRIDDVNEAESDAPCCVSVWQFSTADFIASHSPAHRTTDIGWPAILSWVSSGPALWYDVYFGEDENAVAQATPDSAGIYRGQQTADETAFNTGNLHPNKIYFWRIDGVDSAHTQNVWKGKVWQFSTADFIASHSPANRTTGVGWPINLSWEPRGPGLDYDVYFGDDENDVAQATPDSVGIYCGQQMDGETTFDTGNLKPNTTYFWRIDGVDSAHAQNVWKGTVWQFSTADFIASHSPANRTTDIGWPATLSWVSSGPALRYDVYFGEDENAVAQATPDSVGIYRGQQTAVETAFNTGNLQPNKTYFWRIDGVDNTDAQNVWKGDVWQFTATRSIVQHYPGQNATYIPRSVILSWEPGGPGLQYDLYFGTDEDAVADATPDSVGIYRGQQAPDETTFDPSDLKSGTTYVWRIDAVDSINPQYLWKGNVWRFTTAASR